MSGPSTFPPFVLGGKQLGSQFGAFPPEAVPGFFAFAIEDPVERWACHHLTASAATITVVDDCKSLARCGHGSQHLPRRVKWWWKPSQLTLGAGSGEIGGSKSNPTRQVEFSGRVEGKPQ
jgi:hypothetical protein